MGVAGWILFVVGVLAIVVGLVQGAKDIFVKQNEGAANALLPAEFLKVLGKLLDAPPAKFFCGLGLILVVIGLGLIGPEVF